MLLEEQMRIERDRGPHGQPMSEALNPAADPTENGPYYYEAGVPVVDPGTGMTVRAPAIDQARAAQERAEEAWRNSRGKDARLPHGAHFPVYRVNRPQ